MNEMATLMQLPGRIAALFVAAILIRGICRNERLAVETIIQDFGASSMRGLATASNLRSVTDDDVDVKVSVQVSIESLCIDSKNYILKELVPTFNTALSEVMDLQVVVFGNSHLHTDTLTVSCQHGDAECDANVYQQCAIDNFMYPSRYLPFLACLFEELPMGHADMAFDKSVFAQCAREAALDFRALETCHSKDAWAMQVQSAAKTPSDHDHVPWVVIDGVYVPEDKKSLSQAVCEALEMRGGHHSSCDGVTND